MYSNFTATIGQPDSNSTHTKRFTSWLPAASADDALLLGNGIMGSMVYGQPHNETIILNHTDLYMPLSIPVQPIEQHKVLDEIKVLLLEGNGTAPEKIPLELCKEAGFNGKLATDPYIPAFDVKIKTAHAYNVTVMKPISSIQIGSNLEHDMLVNTNSRTISALWIVAVLALLMSWVIFR